MFLLLAGRNQSADNHLEHRRARCRAALRLQSFPHPAGRCTGQAQGHAQDRADPAGRRVRCANLDQRAAGAAARVRQHAAADWHVGIFQRLSHSEASIGAAGAASLLLAAAATVFAPSGMKPPLCAAADRCGSAVVRRRVAAQKTALSKRVMLDGQWRGSASVRCRTAPCTSSTRPRTDIGNGYLKQKRRRIATAPLLLYVFFEPEITCHRLFLSE